jgi:type II secretory pathway pseudopilin PulG
VVKRKGFTLIETIVYMFLAVLLLALVAAFFKISRRQYEATSSSYLIGQEASTAIQWLKRDLQETALSTVRITRDGTKNAGMPSMSFIAAGSDKDQRSFEVSPYGTPAWNRHVFYSLNQDGVLNRWVRPLSAADLESPKRFLPLPSSADPSDEAGGELRKVLLREVMVPDQEIKIDGKDASFPKMGKWGGFKPGFVVYDKDGKDHLTLRNPSQISEDMATDSGGSLETLEEGVTIPLNEVQTTRLMEIQVALKLKGFRENSPNAVVIPLRVSPGH